MSTVLDLRYKSPQSLTTRMTIHKYICWLIYLLSRSSLQGTKIILHVYVIAMIRQTGFYVRTDHPKCFDFNRFFLQMKLALICLSIFLVVSCSQPRQNKKSPWPLVLPMSYYYSPRAFYQWQNPYILDDPATGFDSLNPSSSALVCIWNLNLG